MSINRYVDLIDKGIENLTGEEFSELKHLFQTVDRTAASDSTFLKILKFEIDEAEPLGSKEEKVIDSAIQDFLPRYNSIADNQRKFEFSDDFCNLIGEIDPDDHQSFELLIDAAIEGEDEDFQNWALSILNLSYGDELAESDSILWDDTQNISLASKIAALIFDIEGVYEDFDFMITSLWLGYTQPLTDKQRQFLNNARPLDIDVKLTEAQATKLLDKLEEAGDREGHAHIIHSLLHYSKKKRYRITESNLANAIVKGAINNDMVEIFQFGDTSQSAYLMPAPFKTLKTAMKEGNERASEILQTILTEKSWRRLRQPRKRGRLAWLIRKITGQSGKFVPKPRKK